jgi:hypothetical protein
MSNIIAAKEDREGKSANQQLEKDIYATTQIQLSVPQYDYHFPFWWKNSLTPPLMEAQSNYTFGCGASIMYVSRYIIA